MKDPLCLGVGIALSFIGAEIFVMKLYDDPIHDDPSSKNGMLDKD